MNVYDFRKRMAELPRPTTDKKPPFWESWRMQLYDLALYSDPNMFFDWPPVYHCFLWRHRPDAIQIELNALKADKDWRIWEPVIVDPNFIQPRDLQPGTFYSQSLIHQTYHVMRWQEITGKKIVNMRKITEFGGGYGCLALVCDRLGFTGKYAIYDLPEFLLLQEYFLSNVFPDGDRVKNVRDIRYYDDAATLFKKHGRSDLLIACYSLSEVPIDRRNLLLPFFPADAMLFLYSNMFAGYDNKAYFDYYAQLKPELKWHTEVIAHLPPESIYKFGWKE